MADNSLCLGLAARLVHGRMDSLGIGALGRCNVFGGSDGFSDRLGRLFPDGLGDTTWSGLGWLGFTVSVIVTPSSLIDGFGEW